MSVPQFSSYKDLTQINQISLAFGTQSQEVSSLPVDKQSSKLKKKIICSYPGLDSLSSSLEKITGGQYKCDLEKSSARLQLHSIINKHDKSLFLYLSNGLPYSLRLCIFSLNKLESLTMTALVYKGIRTQSCSHWNLSISYETIHKTHQINL